MRLEGATWDAGALKALGAQRIEWIPDPKTQAIVEIDVAPDLPLDSDGKPTGYDAAMLSSKVPLLIQEAAASCNTIATQIIPDATHQSAYTNAATIVWANNGNAPSADPAKTVFAQQGVSVGIADPNVFAKVVTTVSLASMELATILGTLKSAVVQGQSVSDLASALSTFETSLNAFVAQLNAGGLTAQIVAPHAITIPGVNT